MVWRVSIYILFLFYRISNGQIQLVSAVNETNAKKLLSEDVGGSIKTLKAKKPDDSSVLLPSQWALGPEGTPRWPNGEIKVYIDSDSYGQGIVARVLMILSKIQSYDSHLCPEITKLEEKPTGPVDGSWLHVTNPDRVRPCVHDAGVDDNGEIKVVLGYDCLKPREILHTLLHGLGFRDEIQHPQRDLFVRVMWENIQPAFRSMFRIQSVETNDAGLMEYDPMSVMHFHDRAFSLNGHPSIMPMLPGLRVEPSDELSHLDGLKIKRMFSHECKKRLVNTIIHQTCAQFDELRGEEVPNNGNGCPPVNGGGNSGNGGGAGGLIIPGNDVKVDKESGEYEGELHDDSDETGANDGVKGYIMPAKSDSEYDPWGGKSGVQQIPYKDGNKPVDKIMIPGNDVKVDDDADAQVADSGVADDNNKDVPVDDGDENEGVDETLGDTKPTKPGKKLKKLLGKKLHNNYNNIPQDEAIVVGYES
ncbi:zinc metalloproteinase nas-8-like [Leguminivora glycinivorella]|uniref:zinc metalloproteinase nas-8-like n=1 Tax=Leguminivora glycinivorella TaxID=1035111 RepID=UPI00200D25F6|nr:zinc metalloproteinase nas-8-like [Leguminivora glycinivorella]